MNTISFNKKNAKMIAHRGASGLERENTAAAFVAAGQRTYFGIETDVHRTADGRFVIIHDDNTMRVSGEDYAVESTSFDTLRALTLFDMDGKTKRGDLKIPTLEEYITICKRYEKICVLELKNAFSEDDIHKIVDIIDGMGYLSSVIFISFCLENLLILRKRLKTQPAQFLTGEINDDTIKTLAENGLDLDAYYRSLNAENVAKLKNAGIKINCWTCDDKADGETLAELGVDFITSNILE